MSAAPAGLAVVGTDTGVGKTAVSCGLLALALARGLRVHPLKPVESGIQIGQPTDADSLQAAARSAEPAHLYRLPDPIAPWLAAERAGVTLDGGVIVERARSLACRDAGILLETAGGLLSPWGRRLTAAHVLATLGLPILLVASDVLGVQNHCLLTDEALRTRGLRLAGLILVAGPTDGDWGNEVALRRLFPETYLGRLPRLAAPTPTELAAALERATDLSSVWACFRT